LTALLGPDPGLAPLSQLLIKRGNPFFLEETVRMLVETGALIGERGAYRLTRLVETLQVPATVQTVLAARIDRLPPEAKQLLQAAAVIGKDVPYALLAAVAEQPEEMLRRGLAHLHEAEFLYETQLFPDLEYSFKHALTHEVTYGSLLADQRRQLHAQIVTAIERIYPDRLSEHVERLAHHALRGQLWDQAVRYSRQAGTRALDRSAFREALIHFEQAVTALRELPDSPERNQKLVDLCSDQRSALWPLGEFVRLGEVLSGARALAERLDDQRQLGRLLGYSAILYSILGEHTRAIEAAESALAIGDATGDIGLRVVATINVGQALWYGGDPQQAAGAAQALISLLEGTPVSERFGLPGVPAALARWFLSAVLGELGEFAPAFHAGEEGLRIAQAAGHLYSEVLVRYGLGCARVRNGDFAEAIRVLEPGLAACRAMEIRLVTPLLASELGSAYLWSGRAPDAVPLLEEAVEAITARRSLGRRSWLVTALAQAYLVVGRLADAREQAEQAVALAHTHPHRGWEAWGLKLLGDVHAQGAAEAEQAQDAYRRALTFASALGMRPLVAHCHFGLAKLHPKTGDCKEAREHLANATALYREMDMRFWLEQAESALAAF
jgi:tetratricopeptide (TPR) repeat protein